MSDVETRFHEDWLGQAQPVEGLVVSVPVLVEAQCFARQPVALRERLRALCPPLDPAADDGPRAVRDLDAFLVGVLGASRPSCSTAARRCRPN